MHCYFVRSLRIAIRLFLLTAAISLANSASAALRTFVLDPSASILTAGGQLYGEAYNEQGPGSLVSKYAGTIVFDLNPGSIQFVGGSLVDAQHSGNWSPATGSGTGSGAADYGAFTNDTSGGQPITIRLASRALVADLTSGVLPMTGDSFSANGINFAFTQGGTDFTVILNASGGSVQMGHSTLVGRNANNVGGTGSYAGSLLKTLTIPIDVDVPIDGDNNGSFESIFALTGQLVAVESQRQLGDFDIDGDVDGADFVAWQTAFPSTIGGGPADGDGDGDVDGADFVIWQSHFPFGPSSPGVSPVPEPASICLLMASVVCAAMYRRLHASRTAARGL